MRAFSYQSSLPTLLLAHVRYQVCACVDIALSCNSFARSVQGTLLPVCICYCIYTLLSVDV